MVAHVAQQVDPQLKSTDRVRASFHPLARWTRVDPQQNPLTPSSRTTEAAEAPEPGLVRYSNSTGA